MSSWEFWIDRGGTFTDVIARRPDGRLVSEKLLSEDPGRYRDAALEGMRRVLGLSPGESLPLAKMGAVKMGTTVATNALLEHRGEPVVLFITRGFRDQLRIGYQNRPKLFEREIRLPEPLYQKVVEVDERVGVDGEVIVPLDAPRLRADLEQVYAEGFRAVALVFLHAWLHKEHETLAAELARDVGFSQVSASHEVSPLIKIVTRGQTTVVDAHLSPILRRYVAELRRELEQSDAHAPLYFMKSDGGLTRATTFRGKDAILSGPAGGIVGMVQTALAAGFRRVIGFDMGGTSTDVSHFCGDSLADCERSFDTTAAGVRLQAPMLAIHSIAAGGGSILHFDGQRFRVGPDSAGADPGPLSYRRGGPLTLTDCNLLLGKLEPELFPKVFGPDADAGLDRAAVEHAFSELSEQVTRATGRRHTPEEVAAGFLRVAVTNMANAIRSISIARGYDVTEYALVCFGGAGGQHACLVADELGMTRVLIHPLSGVLSALGMGLSDVTALRQQAFERRLESGVESAVARELERLSTEARAELTADGISDDRIEVLARVHLKYEGTDSALIVPAGGAEAMRGAFEREYMRRFSFLMPDKSIVIEALSVEARGAGRAHSLDAEAPYLTSPNDRGGTEPVPFSQTRMVVKGSFRETPVFRRAALAPGRIVHGPAIIAEQGATTVVEEDWLARVTRRNDLVLERVAPRDNERRDPSGAPDPVLLEVFNNLFMSIAERMGVQLQNSAHSVNIKERLDFSCAVFDGTGNLVANAPHMPVHLGSMSESIKTVIAKNAGHIQPGDAFALNDPYHGGTHLPDVTVVLPVFSKEGDTILFYVAARGHHADIGGITPGSMPPNSRSIEDEGVLIDNFKLVESGRFHEKALRRVLLSARHPARNPEQNLADLRAQVAACEKGRTELDSMVDHFGLAQVKAYMRHVQNNAEESVRRVIEALKDGEFSYEMDNGALVRVCIRVDPATRSAVVDFSGSSPELPDNFNAPPAVVQAAVLYVFRTLVPDEIPMNAGCLKPIRIVIPEGSLLAPRFPAATVAGNVETSQVVTDALYGALGMMAGSQSTMNNFTFGNERYQYYETVAGGSGAGKRRVGTSAGAEAERAGADGVAGAGGVAGAHGADGFAGTAAVQTHMTNSRLTDPEVLELRFPVRIEEHSIRSGSGGKARFPGGDGALRRVRFLEPMTAAILSGARRIAPFGLEGGQNGALGRTWVERADGSRRELAHAEEVEMRAGDVFVISTPSGGGYGAP